ncbi:MAG: hypothetical protein IJ668_07400 [Selenomonadaceae bacterium]|nr:hypothetical protein [Selenomonadaceae bacterium]
MPTSIETPSVAIEEIRSAINARDRDRLTERIDLKSFIDLGYDDAIDQLALNCDRFHQKYPDDLLFKFGATALRVYNAMFRSVHIGLITRVIQSYFEEKFDSPPPFSSDPIGCCSHHFDRLVGAIRSEIVEEERDDVTVELRAELIGTLRIRLETALVDGRRRVIKIANADELVEPIVDIAERVWPREWDRGIQL